MGLMKQYLLGRHLTKLVNVFEAVATYEGVVATSVCTINHEQPESYRHLPLSIQVQIRLELPKRIPALRIHPRHVITRELIKNTIITQSMRRDFRVLAYSHLFDYLLERDIALDIDTFNASYGN
jgi:hypothetical protein